MLRLSHSQIKLFKECQRHYYYKYVLKLPEKDVETKYLHMGSAVHKVLEDFHNGTNKNWQENAKKQWEKYKLEGRMNYNTYFTAIQYGVIQEDAIRANQTEAKIFLQIGNYQFVGYLDICDTENDVILDWKTGKYSKQKENDYKFQLLCYAYLYYRKYQRLPKKCILFFAQENKPIIFSFRKDEILEYEQIVKKIGKEIEDIYKKKELEIPQNFNACHFCPYKNQCFSSTKRYEYTIIIKNNFAFLEGQITPTLLEGLDRSMKYDLKEKYYIQQAVMRKNGGKRPANYDDIGTVHLFDKRRRMFAVGAIEKVKQIIQQYCAYHDAQAIIIVRDLRDKNVTEKKLGIMPKKLHTDKELWPHQIKAIEAFIHYGSGYLEIATGGGKTLLTAELIRIHDTPTLWIIDRKELLYQTKKVFEELLGIEVGMIAEGKFEPKDVTVATIQTLYSRIRQKEVKDYLASINFVIVDEAHHSSAESYQAVFKELRNTKYRLGTTATVKRDDGNEPVLKWLIGDIIYAVSAKELEETGFLMKPEIRFLRWNQEYISGQEYHEVYEEAIINNEVRNNIILGLIADALYYKKKVLLLIGRINHGNKLLEMMEERFPGKAFFLHGNTDNEVRKKQFEDFKLGKLMILIGTMSIFSEGIDIPDLDIIINAAANKGEVKSIQVLGRVLRKSFGKTAARYYDFMDYSRFLDKAAKKRMKVFQNQGHEVQVMNYNRNTP